MAKRICIVVQRYGREVNGGAELEARQLAEHLTALYPDIHVATTKAIDYTTWANEYEADIETINGVTVHRFPVECERNMDEFNEINGRFLSGNLSPHDEEEWVKMQGPYVPELIEFIKNHKDEFDAFIFFTYLYYPTVMGIREVSEKAISVPTAHDEPFLRMEIFKDVFERPKTLLFNTEEEKNLVHERFESKAIPFRVGAAGVDVPSKIDVESFKQKFNLDNYIVYVGRIDEGKNCSQLFNYFLEYKKRKPSDLKLVLLGKEAIKIPQNDDIISLGFVSEEDKFNGLAGAKVMVLPSKYESLSFVVLEAMLVDTPVMVYGECDVLRGHCIKSNGALYYDNYLEFEKELELLINDEKTAQALCMNAHNYAESGYRWNRILENVTDLIEII